MVYQSSTVRTTDEVSIDQPKLVNNSNTSYRDPWWIFTCLTLFHVIRKCYGTGVFGLVKQSPRFGIMLSAIVLSIIFTIIDIVASIHSFLGKTDGINPWWKLSLVFKCLTDTIMLDDFKTELKRLGVKRMQKEKEEARRKSSAGQDFGAFRLSPSHGSPRPNMFDQFSQTLAHPKAFGSESTIVDRSRDSRDDNREDPLSEYSMMKEEQRKSKHIAEEIEFAQGWNLQPTHDTEFGLERRNDSPTERDSSKTTTKKISQLPQLGDIKAGATRAGSGINTNDSNNSSSEDKDIEKQTPRNEEEEDEHENRRIRNMAEGIYRRTVVDLDLQRRARALREAAIPPGADPDDDDADGSQRVRRFKMSIGVA